MQLDINSTFNRRIIDFNNFGFKQGIVLGRYNYNKPEKSLSEHVHKGMLEICYYDKGSQIFSVANEEHLVKGGEVFLHYPNETHSTGGYPEEKGCLYWMIIELAGNNETDDLDTEDITLLCQKIIAIDKRHFKGSTELKKTLERIFTIVNKREDNDVKLIRLKVLVKQFLLELIDCSTSNKNTKEIDSVRLNKVLDYINNNIDSHISLETLANEIHISESRFKSLFKELTGFTPGDYIQRKRIEMAVEIIKNEPDTLFTELAYRLDFSSPQYFSTVIKKYTGKTPEDLRGKS